MATPLKRTQMHFPDDMLQQVRLLVESGDLSVNHDAYLYGGKK